MKKTPTTRYDEKMTAYLEACLEVAGGDAAFIAKALGDITREKGMAFRVMQSVGVDESRA